MAIVASDIAANVNILKRCGNALFYPCADPNALADQLVRLLDNAAEYQELRLAAQTCVKFDESYALPIIREIVSALQHP